MPIFLVYDKLGREGLNSYSLPLLVLSFIFLRRENIEEGHISCIPHEINAYD